MILIISKKTINYTVLHHTKEQFFMIKTIVATAPKQIIMIE